jgi:hypothetical protein
MAWKARRALSSTTGYCVDPLMQQLGGAPLMQERVELGAGVKVCEPR